MHRITRALLFSLIAPSFTLMACSDIIQRGGGSSSAAPIEGEEAAENYEPGYIPTSTGKPGDDGGDEQDIGEFGVPGGDSDGDGFFDALEEQIGTDPQDGGTEVCGLANSEVELVELDLDSTPLDFIFMVDVSGSMVEELPRIEDGIGDLISTMLRDSRDAQVILLANATIFCADPNGSGRSCAPKPLATNDFLQYDALIASVNSLDVALDSIARDDPHGLAPGGWGERLRPEAFKVFIEITDDDSSIPADLFLSQLAAIDAERGYGFYNQAGENFIFHSVIGVEAGNRGMTPEEGLSQNACLTAVNAGFTYQELSLQTGGLRFSVCGDPDYSQIFEVIADSEPVRTISCSYAPQVTNEEKVDWTRVGLQVETGTSRGRVLSPVTVEGGCGDGGEFLVQGNTVQLCPEVCEALRSDTSVDSVTAVVACEPEECDPSATMGCE